MYIHMYVCAFFGSSLSDGLAVAVLCCISMYVCTHVCIYICRYVCTLHAVYITTYVRMYMYVVLCYIPNKYVVIPQYYLCKIQILANFFLHCDIV